MRYLTTMQMAKMLKDNITMQTIMYQALALQNHTYTWEIRYWDQKWLDMWSMSSGPLHWSMSTLVMVQNLTYTQ